MTPGVTMNNEEVCQPSSFASTNGRKHHPTKLARVPECVSDRVQHEEGVFTGSDGTDSSTDFSGVGVARGKLQDATMISSEFSFEHGSIKVVGAVFLHQ